MEVDDSGLNLLSASTSSFLSSEYGPAAKLALAARRSRSDSVSDDYATVKTNDEATEAKLAAVRLGYWRDPYIGSFIYASAEGALPRRDPEISRGYWARVAGIWLIVEKFIKSQQVPCQIISLGAGFDTLYWRLWEKGLIGSANVARFVEVDFSTVTSKKIHHIQRPANRKLLDALHKQTGGGSAGGEGEPVSEGGGHADLHSSHYHLLGADVRQLAELDGKLELANLSNSAPTLLLAECVLVYMSASQSGQLLAHLAERFNNSCILNYEQVNLDDNFGRVMEQNLYSRGLSLPGTEPCNSIKSQEDRFKSNGWPYISVHTLQLIYDTFLSKSEVARIEKIELLDEKELLEQLLEHYCIVIASNTSALADSVRF